MKKMQNLLIIVLALMSSAFIDKKEELKIGDLAPLANLKMQDISGTSYSLNDLKQTNGLLVIFSCNTCPFVAGWEDEYPVLGDIASRNNLGVALINSNEAKRKDEDALMAMKSHAQNKNYNTPYLVDVNSQLADAFGASTTPHVFLFDKNMKLVYKGSINDKFENKDKSVSKHYLRDAIVNMMAGKKPNPSETKQIGCSIKRI